MGASLVNAELELLSAPIFRVMADTGIMIYAGVPTYQMNHPSTDRDTMKPSGVFLKT